jgi:hypothetical protein
MAMTDEDAGQFLAGGFNVIGECHRLIAVSEEINDNHILCIGKQIAVYICLLARITLSIIVLPSQDSSSMIKSNRFDAMSLEKDS